MTISKTLDGDKLVIALEGRLDTVSSPDLEKEIKEVPASVKEIVMDLENLEYISSAGLRVFLYIQKKMAGGMKIIHANEIVREVFEVTGFIDTFTVE